MAALHKTGWQFSCTILVLGSVLFLQVLPAEANVLIVNNSTVDLFVFETTTKLVINRLLRGQDGEYPLSEQPGGDSFVIEAYDSTQDEEQRSPLATVQVLGNATLTIFDSSFPGSSRALFGLLLIYDK